MRGLLLTCAFLFLISPAKATSSDSCPGLLLETNLAGKVVGGSRSDLIAASERGERIRVGWRIDFDNDGTADISHWSDAIFITVFEGEVFTQVQSIHRQRPIRGQGQVALNDAFSVWHGLLGSNGRIQGRLNNSEETGGRRVHTIWCREAPRWTIVYVNDTDGATVSGSKKALIEAIRAGHDIQVGWGLARTVDGIRKSVEHLVAPVFITITDETEVVVQLPEHIAQASYWDAEKARFSDPAVMWRGVMATTGSFDAVWVNRSTGEEIRRAPQRARMTWYVNDPKAGSTLAVPDGVISDR